MQQNSQQDPSEIEELKMHIAELHQLYSAATMELVKKSANEGGSQSDRRFKTIFDQSNIACKIINRDLEILEVNDAVSTLLGYSRSDLVGNRIIMYTRQDFKEHWQSLQNALWNTNLPFFQLEACLIKHDGSEVWCNINTILFEDQHETFGYTMLEDITHRKEKDQKKNELIDVVSHELKTPVTTLRALAQILEKRLSTLDTDSAKVMLRKIVIQSERLSSLIHDLMDVTRIESGKLMLRIAPFNFSELLDDVVSNFKSSSKHAFHIEIEDNIICNGEASRLEQVVINLISNAIKYSPNADKIVIAAFRDDNNLTCKVQDFGSGISQPDQIHLFERFFRTNDQQDGKTPGLGLGLYICAEIIELHKGKLWVESEIGKGSTFGFSLPLMPV